MGFRVKFRLALAVLMVAVVVFAGGGAVGQSTQRFSDLAPEHYAHDAAVWADAVGVTGGCGDGSKFCPDRNLTRAHMITFLKRYEDWIQDGRPATRPVGAPGGGAVARSSQRFSDLAPGHYAHDAAVWADAVGVTGGCGDGSKFCPDRNLTRARMITFLKR